MLTMPVLGALVCEWLLYFAVSQTCSQCLSLALQEVGAYYALLNFKPTHNCCLWSSSLWVAAVPCCDSSLLTMSVFDSSGYEWLTFLLVFQVCWCSWLSRWWVAAVLHCISSWLMTLVWDLQNVSGCLLCCMITAHNSCPSLFTPQWSYSSMVYQHVGAFFPFKPDNGVHFWFFRLWVFILFLLKWENLTTFLRQSRLCYCPPFNMCHLCITVICLCGLWYIYCI